MAINYGDHLNINWNTVNNARMQILGYLPTHEEIEIQDLGGEYSRDAWFFMVRDQTGTLSPYYYDEYQKAVLPFCKGGVSVNPSEAKYFNQFVGDGVNTKFIIKHELGKKFVNVNVWEPDGNTKKLVHCDVYLFNDSDNYLGIQFAYPPSTNQFIVDVNAGENNYTQQIGDNITKDFIIHHGLSSQNVITNLWERKGARYYKVQSDLITPLNSFEYLELSFAYPPTINQYLVSVS